MADSSVPCLLWITDRAQCAGRTIAHVAQQFCAGAQHAGLAAGVMLREKDLAGGDLYGHAQSLRMIAREYGATFLVNGRIDVAVAAEADGVHLPQNELRPNVARSLIGAKLLGVSCHTQQEVRAAADAGADYVTFGPVYETASKRAYGPPLGLEALAAACAACSVPVLALGGIEPNTGAAALDAGAHGLAFISAVAAADDPAAAAAGFAALFARSVAR